MGVVLPDHQDRRSRSGRRSDSAQGQDNSPRERLRIDKMRNQTAEKHQQRGSKSFGESCDQYSFTRSLQGFLIKRLTNRKGNERKGDTGNPGDIRDINQRTPVAQSAAEKNMET